jgi:Asp-tRNA(Asn)/Glu-tRNA(Gln) amidotransferase A subunit family amidase
LSESSSVDDLETAFWAYERALMSNDLPELDRFFARGPDTMRGDAAGLLVGHSAISEFRASRGGSPARTIAHVEFRPLTDATALVIAVTAPTSGGRGQQTQLWRRDPAPDGRGQWRIAAAHVALPTRFDSATWRVQAAPLIGGGKAGPLTGQSVAVKDLFAVAGFAIGAGVPQYLADAPVERTTAMAVQLLLDAGASVAGIAQTDEFAYSIAGRNPHYGTPPNVLVVGGIPGGSTSGPATAVALGQASIGLGTDTGGSIRVPASYQGLWGLRTTHGSMPTSGLLPLSPSFDTVGWLARSAATLRAAAAVSLTRSDQRSVEPRFVVAPALSAIIEPELRPAFHAGLERIQAAGFTDIEQVDLGDLDHLFETFRTVQAAEAWASHGAWVTEHPGALGSEIAARFEWASTVSASAEAAARVDRAAARARLEDVIGDRVLLLPAASSVAPSASADAATIERTRAATLRLTCIAGLTGRPGLSAPLLWVPVPGQFTPAPVGLSFVGPRGTDLALIDLAAAL